MADSPASVLVSAQVHTGCSVGCYDGIPFGFQTRLATTDYVGMPLLGTAANGTRAEVGKVVAQSTAPNGDTGVVVRVQSEEALVRSSSGKPYLAVVASVTDCAPNTKMIRPHSLCFLDTANGGRTAFVRLVA